jgi:hypothetical protein
MMNESVVLSVAVALAGTPFAEALPETVTVPSDVEPLKKVTEPVGATPLLAVAIVAVNEMGWPAVTVIKLGRTAVAVTALVIVIALEAEVLGV